MFPEHASYLEKAAFFSEKVTIYPVSCEVLANGRSDIEWLEAVLAGGARIVQLRDKHSDDLTLYRKALVFSCGCPMVPFPGYRFRAPRSQSLALGVTS